MSLCSEQCENESKRTFSADNDVFNTERTQIPSCFEENQHKTLLLAHNKTSYSEERRNKKHFSAPNRCIKISVNEKNDAVIHVSSATLDVLAVRRLQPK